MMNYKAKLMRRPGREVDGLEREFFLDTLGQDQARSKKRKGKLMKQIMGRGKKTN
jgi:hypothetical protein